MLKSTHTTDDIETWAALIAHYFLPVRASEKASAAQNQPVNRKFFQANIYGRKWGNITLAQLSTGAHKLSQNSALLTDESRCLKLNVQTAGRGIIIQDGKEAVLEAGEFALLDSSAPYSVIYEGQSVSQVLQFPRHLVNLPENSIRELSVLPFTKANPLTRSLTQLAQDSCQALLTLPDSVSRRLTGNLIDFLHTVVTGELYSGSSDPLEKEKIRQREVIATYIRENLEKQELSPRLIASENYMSVRALHQLFEGTGDTVSSTILELRLKRCREDLENPAHAATPISAIAARWGFSDSAHFSRTFRHAYGTTPSKWRSTAVRLAD